MFCPNILQLAEAVLLAGSPIHTDFRQSPATKIKEDGTPVTTTDHAVQQGLKSWAQKQDDLGYIGEEGDTFSPDQDQVLYVDPLDGTNAYSWGLASATVAATLMKRHSDTHWKPVMSIIHDPIHYWTWCSNELGDGFLIRQDQGVHRIPLGVTKIRTPWRVTAVAWRHAPHHMELIRNELEARRDMDHQPFGATALGGGLIASGLTNAILFGGESAIETAAMSLVVRSAGGIATDLFGTELGTYALVEKNGKYDFYLPHGSIMSSSQELTDHLVHIVKSVQ